VKLTLLSNVYFARGVLPLMQQRRWGRFITITSISVKQPINGMVLSNSLRAGVAALAKMLAKEFGANDIAAKNVCPGYTLTDRLKRLATHHGSPSGVSAEQMFE
jgi:3-oxoacyl-[acyl-carrier protein] reductase